MAKIDVYRHSDVEKSTYSALAPFYDRLMGHVEYDSWLDLIDRVKKKYIEKPDPTIFEIGGGTGILGRKLVEKGYRYIGSDFSPHMCSQAHDRKLSTFCCDGRALALKKKFDLVVWLYDGINYLMSLDDYHSVFQEVYEILPPNGLFLFDITTEANSLRHFSDSFDYEDYGDYLYIRHSWFDEISFTQHNDFTIFRNVRPKTLIYEKLVENHEQKVFPARSIEEVIPRSHFAVVGIYDDYSFRRYTSKSERIHFLLRKVGP